MKQVSLYYVAAVEKKRCWFLAATLRGTEHVAFDRCIDKEKSIFEFFVPHDMRTVFLEVMEYLKKDGVILSLEQRENRLLTEEF